MGRLVLLVAFIALIASLVWYAATHFERLGSGVAADSSATQAPAPGRPPIATLPVLRAPCGPACGTQRWAVKTLSDGDREEVDLRPVPATVESLAALPRPAFLQDDRRAAEERRTFEVIGCLGVVDNPAAGDDHLHRRISRRREDDRDIHLVIGGLLNPRVSLIAEIPSPECGGVCQAGLGELYARARAAVDSIIKAPPSPACNNDVPLVRITGVGFFDHEHGQIGAAPNQFELHPVLSLSTVDHDPR
jgi:hypothetical protein